jgi:hypothetical protein
MTWKSSVLVSLLIAAGAFGQVSTTATTGPQAPQTQTTQTTAPPVIPPPVVPVSPPANLPEGTQLPSEVALGAVVPVPVRNVTAADRVAVVLNDGKKDFAASAKIDGSSVVFTLPSDLLPGRYTVRFTVNEKTVLPVPGELRVAGAAQATPVITGISTPVYPPEQGELYSFSILGDHFGNQNDTSVEIALRSIRYEATDCSGTLNKLCIKVSPHVIDVFGFRPQRFEGPVNVSVRVGSLRSETKPVTFSHHGIRSVRWFAFMGTAFIAVLVYLLVRRGVGPYQIGHLHFGAFSMFIIDKDTHSYSLSKLQLLLWTCASVFTYIYFYLCRILIQWSSDFPDVPPGMATLLGLSAGTTVAAAGLAAARGPKGAGPLSPTFADFISSGGVVIAERFQFFVWTIVGVLSFVGLVLNHDPANLSQLPPIPDNFLALMGVSSAGYLAGKAVRRAGPVISRVDTAGTTTGNKLVLKIDGQNIEENATLRIDKEAHIATPDQNSKRAQDGGGGFYTHLEWSIPWVTTFEAPTHLLEIENQDGQVAATDLTLKTFRITNASDVPATKNEATVVATVSDAVGTFEGEWSQPGSATSTPILAAKIEVAGNSVRIKLTPGDIAGAGRLALIDSSGQRALVTVNVIGVTAKPASVPANTPAPVPPNAAATAPANKPATVTVSGDGLPTLVKATWKPAKGAATDAAIVPSANGYDVTFDPGEKGEGTLEVSDGMNFTAQMKITVA